MRQRIQNAIIDLARGATYPAVSVSAADGKITTGGANVDLASCHCDEIRAEYGPARLNRQQNRREIQTWTFQVILVFNRRVDLVNFQALFTKPPILPRQAPDNLQATLNLTGITLDHPPEQGPSAGTRAICTIVAEIAPQ